MVSAELQTQAYEQVIAWLGEEFDQPLDVFNIIPLPNLNTSHFASFMVEQKKLRMAGDLYLMSDGKVVLLASQKHFAQVIKREGFFEQPDVIPPEKIAELYLRMGEARGGGIITKRNAFPLQALNETERAQFAPPRIEQQPDQVVIHFWSSGLSPTAVTQWAVIIYSDYSIKTSEIILSD